MLQRDRLRAAFLFRPRFVDADAVISGGGHSQTTEILARVLSRITIKLELGLIWNEPLAMSAPDSLGQRIHALQQWQRTAWRQLAEPLLTTFERREIRNQIKLSNIELRHYLEMMSERTAVRVPIEDVGDSSANLNFRLFA